MPDKTSEQQGEARAPLLKDKPQIRFDVRKCPIESVVVYTDRAEVKREVCAQLHAGETELVVERLSTSINGESIRVEGVGAATILDVIYQTTEKEQEKSAEDDLERSEDAYKAIVAAKDAKKKELKILSFTQQTLEKQKLLLEQFAKQVCMIKSQKPEDMLMVAVTAVDSVMEFMEGYQARVAGIDNRLLDLETATNKLKEEIKVLKDRARKVNPDEGKKGTTETVRSVKVTLGTEEDVNVKLFISYVVFNASWSPSYDLRVFTKDKSMKVHYYGLIKQSTGEDWENANISLSTAQPSVGGSAPQLGVQYIQFKQPAYRYFPSKAIIPGASLFSRRYDSDDDIYGAIDTKNLEYENEDSDWDEYEQTENLCNIRMAAGSAKPRRSAPPLPPPPPQMKVDVAKVASGQLYNTTYSIPRTSTIPADSTEHRVTVAVIDLQPQFSYVSVPRLSPYSFLQATVKNTSAYTILSGPANVFLDNNFLTKSEMTSTSPNEEFTSSLGADQAIRITCEPVSTVRRTHGRLTKNNQVSQTHVFQVKNTQANPVELKVMEQVPLTQDEKLKVAVQEPAVFSKPGARMVLPYGYALLNSSNNVEWHCTIPQDTTITLKLAYTIEYPIDCTVKGLPST